MRDALSKASFIGITGTLIENGDKNTQAVFGDYIDVYDILQSKEDKATVQIYHEARLAKIDLKPEERPKIDPNFEEGASRTGNATALIPCCFARFTIAVGDKVESKKV